MKHLFCTICVGAGLAVALLSWAQEQPQQPATGPHTEKRFPALHVPAGFKATLFACDPLIEYPSAIALGPRPGSLFVAVDYLTGLGMDIVKRDEVRLIEDSDGDGYADKATVFAGGFNSIQGMTFHDGTLYVMHAPYLSAVRDSRGAGKADERRELIAGLGLPPEKDQVRLHNANGVVMGHDGWLYLAMGDRGCDVKRPEGDRLVLEGGGVLRCRPDGRDLHVFSTGLRNIYDVALDAELNVFVRDNENDGGAYKVRVCHSFFGADHGYPYLYAERPDEALAPLADLGLGSSAGGLCYLEDRFPAGYRGSLFFCEWGRAVVRYEPTRTGTAFGPVREIDFAAGAPDDPYGFKPTDLVVDRDGALFIADWADGQRPRRGRGRIYRVHHEGSPRQGDGATKSPLQALDSTSYYERCAAQRRLERQGKIDLAQVRQLGVRGRLHAVWIIAKGADGTAVETLMAQAKSDPEPRVQAQALRAIADLADPILLHHRLDAGPGDAALAARIAALAAGSEPPVVLEAVIALGRLRWWSAPPWLAENVKQPDAALAHAAQGALRRSGNWRAVLQLLDQPADAPIRAVALRAVADQYDASVVDDLASRLAKEPAAARRREYADLLTRVSKKPGPWTYWGFRPPPRPAPVVAWQRTGAIAEALDRVLRDPDVGVRRHTLARMSREKIEARTATLVAWLGAERDPDTVAALLTALADHPPKETRAVLEAVLADPKQAPANRRRAVAQFIAGADKAPDKAADKAAAPRLLAAAHAVEDGPVLADLLRALAARIATPETRALFRAKRKSRDAEVRARAIDGLAAHQAADAGRDIIEALGDADPRVRRAAALASGRLGLKDSTEDLLRLAGEREPQSRGAALDALRRLREPRAVPLAVAALDDRATALAALECLHDLGGPAQAGAVVRLARREPAVDVLGAAAKTLVAWAARFPADRGTIDQALAEIHGHGGAVLAWHVRTCASPARAEQTIAALGETMPDAPPWRRALAAGIDARVRVGDADQAAVYVGVAQVEADAGPVEFEATTSGPATVWVNGKQVHRQDRPAGANADRFQTQLRKGRNRVALMLTMPKAGPGKESPQKAMAEWSVRLRRKSALPDIERYTAAALARPGNAKRGREVFLRADKSLCIKCHRVGDEGERVGPELTGLGSRFAKIHIIESILQPSRAIAPSYESSMIALKNGRVLKGIKIAEDDASITLVDDQAARHVIAKRDVEEQRRLPVSTMPEGVERRLTENEFVDLIAYLLSLKEKGR